MFRGLLKFILILVLVVGVAAFVVGYLWSGSDVDDVAVVDRDPVVGTTGTLDDPDVDVDADADADGGVARARETGADIGERVAVGASEAGRMAEAAAITAKVKSKMALDDTVEAFAINVDTTGSVVTLTGAVASEAARTRALDLARDTDGVTQVVDRLEVEVR